MATIKSPHFEWGKSDCLIDIFGEGIHERLSFLKDDHNEVLLWVLSLTVQERWDLFRATAQGQGFVRVDKPEPGDAAISIFAMAIDGIYELPQPWFAQMGHDHLWYVRMPKSIRVVDHIGELEVYRCQVLL